MWEADSRLDTSPVCSANTCAEDNPPASRAIWSATVTAAFAAISRPSGVDLSPTPASYTSNAPTRAFLAATGLCTGPSSLAHAAAATWYAASRRKAMCISSDDALTARCAILRVGSTSGPPPVIHRPDVNPSRPALPCSCASIDSSQAVPGAPAAGSTDKANELRVVLTKMDSSFWKSFLAI